MSELLTQLSDHLSGLHPSVFGRDTHAPFQLNRLSGGHHNVNYSVHFKGDERPSHVLRFYPTPQEDGVDVIVHEHTRLKVLDGVLAPRVYHLGNPDFLPGSFLLMEFIPGEHRSYDAMPKEHVQALAGVLADIHAQRSPTFSPSPGTPHQEGTYLDAAKAAHQTWVITPLGKVNLEHYSEAAQLLNRAITRYEEHIQQNARAFAGSSFALLHGDPNPGNVLWHDQGITFIDWSESEYGDPAAELSFLFTVNHVSSEFKEGFLAAYEERHADPYLQARITVHDLGSRIADLVWSLGNLERERLGTGAELLRREEGVFRGYYEQRLEALRRLLNS